MASHLSDGATIVRWIYGHANEPVTFVKCTTTTAEAHTAPAGSVNALMQVYFPEVKKVAVSLLTTPADVYALDPRVFPWLPYASVHKHSLVGSLLTVVLLSLCDEDACRSTCPCRLSIMCWFNCVLFQAEQLGWTPLKMSSEPALEHNEAFFQVLYEAFPAYLRCMSIDFKNKDERVRSQRFVDATHDDLLGDYLFARVAFRWCGGWLAVMGPPSLREDPSFLADCLDFYWSSLSERRVEFLQYIPLELLTGVVLRMHRLLEFPSLQKKELAVQVLQLDHRLSEHFKLSLRELPEVALACGLGYARRNPESPTRSLFERLPSTLDALRNFRGTPGSKLRRATVDLVRAFDAEGHSEIEAACQRVQRLIGTERADKDRPISAAPPPVATPPPAPAPAPGGDPERELEKSLQTSIEVANRIASEARAARRGKAGMASRTFAGRDAKQGARANGECDEVPPLPQPQGAQRKKSKPKLSEKERLQSEQFLKECRPAIEAAKLTEGKVHEDAVPEIERRLRGVLDAARRQEKRSARMQRLFEARKRVQDLLLR